MIIISRVGTPNGFGRSVASRPGALSRALAAFLVLVALLVAGSATPTHATPRADIIDCGDTDAPMPASPYGDGSFIVPPSTALKELPEGYEPGGVVDAQDPFRSPEEVSIESVYGTAAQWWTFETGCTGKFVAGAGTSLANVVFQVSAILPSWSHALLDTVVGESDLFAVLDAPVKSATEAVAAGVWEPWLPVAVLLVAGLVLWRARSGRLGGAVTAAGTALGALVLTSVLIQYPTESVHLVDAGVRNATGMIATGFSEGKVFPNGTGATSGEGAVIAVDAQMDDIVRQTQYRTWLGGVFGDPDTAVAKEYGPRVFRATHFSWAEYASYRSDPEDVGREIVEAKQAAFKQAAEDIERADPVAYEHFKGEHWTGRTTSALVNLAVVCVPCLFLLLAALIAVAGFVLIRIVVPLAPAAGVIFMIDRTRDLAVSWLKLVVGPLVMGPVCFLIALVLLRFTSAIFEADAVVWVVKIGIIVVLTVIAFRLSGALDMVPGYTRARSRITAAFSQMLGTAAGTTAGLRDGEVGAATGGHDELVSTGSGPRGTAVFPGGVWNPLMEARAPSRRALAPLEGFVPYTPPPKELGAGASTAGVAASAQATATPAKTQYGWPIGPHPLIRARDKFPPPAVNQTLTSGPLGARTNFPPRRMTLEPNTAYMVPGRGTYYTGDQAEVSYVETDFGTKGNLNWDLNYPASGVTYVVGDRFVYMTDPETRTSRAIDVQSVRGAADRSESIQSSVGKAGGKGYDGGHLHQNAHAGGAERINIVAMLQELNRSGTTEFGSIPNSFYAFETELRAMVDVGRNVSVDLHVRYPKDSTDRTPTMIRAVYTVDGGRPMRRTFENVRDE